MTDKPLLISKLAKICIGGDGKYRLKFMSDPQPYCPFPDIKCCYLDKDKVIVDSRNLWYWGCAYKKRGE